MKLYKELIHKLYFQDEIGGHLASTGTINSYNSKNNLRFETTWET